MKRESNVTAYTRRPGTRLQDGEVTFLPRTPIDIDLAKEQHEAYRLALSVAGATVIDLPSNDRFPDSTFVEDVLLALPECFVLCRPGTDSRREETELMMEHLSDDRPSLQLDGNATLDGGDVLQIGRTIFIGLSGRTHMAAVKSLHEILGPFAYELIPVKVTGSLHLKTAVTALLPDLLLANPAWVDLTPFGPRHLIEVDSREPFAGNSLSVGQTRFMQAAHVRTADRVRNAGFSPNLIDISEFAKLEAGLTCLSVIVPPHASVTTERDC